MSISEFTENIARDQVIPISVFVAILCLCLVIGHLLEENRWLNESTTAIVVGCITGTIILFLSKGKSSHIQRFNEELFFIYLLPPIIFNAGFQVKKKQFFQNFLTIMLFGVIGVFISSSIITAGSWWLFARFGFTGLSAQDYLAIGTIFSSTDTVCTLQVLHQDETPLLYSLVFGEGVVNDATSVVLFNAVQKLDKGKLNGRAALRVLLDFLYLFSTSTALGVIAGLLTAYILKTLYIGRHSTVREITLMVLMAYLSYMLAELLHLSGILTVFFCGILMSHYAWHNVTQGSRITTRHIFATMSFTAETFIFLYVGMDALDIEKWRLSKLSFRTSMGIYSTVVLLILLGRAAFVFPLTAFSNYVHRRADRLASVSFKHQVIIWWAGLMRGAVSIALAFKQLMLQWLLPPQLSCSSQHCCMPLWSMRLWRLLRVLWVHGMRVKLLHKQMGKYGQRRKGWKGCDLEKNNNVGAAAHPAGDEENHNLSEYHNSREHHDETPNEEDGEHLTKEKNGKNGQKGRNRGRSRGQKYRGMNGQGHGTLSSSYGGEGWKPPPGPRMPDGTRGFTMGRGRPPPVSTPPN